MIKWERIELRTYYSFLGKRRHEEASMICRCLPLNDYDAMSQLNVNRATKFLAETVAKSNDVAFLEESLNRRFDHVH